MNFLFVLLVLNNIFYNSNLFLYIYLFIYNCTLLSLLFVFMSSVITNFKTMHSLSGYSFDGFLLISISVSLFSLAGVPPFVGFFSKLFLLNMLSNSNLASLYFLLFIILFLALYFYIQNLRFLHSSNTGYLTVSYVFNERRSLFITYYLLTTIFFLSFGFLLIDDLILLFLWLLF